MPQVPEWRNLGTPFEKRQAFLRLQRLSQMRFFSLEPANRENLRKMRESYGVSDERGREMQ